MRIFKGPAISNDTFLETMATLADSIGTEDVKGTFSKLKTLENSIKGFRKHLMALMRRNKVSQLAHSTPTKDTEVAPDVS